MLKLQKKLNFKPFYQKVYESKFQGQDEVLLETKNQNFTKVIFNRPHRLNSINLNMVDIIEKYIKPKAQNKNSLHTIFIEGAGGRAYSSGGDLRSHLTNYLNNEGNKQQLLDAVGVHNFRCFLLAQKMRDTSNLIQISHLNGIVMGQGAGFGMLAPIKISTENTLFAMPEGRIGFFADAGGSYFLTRLKKNIGMYLALTGNRLKGQELYQCGLTTHHIQSSQIQEIQNELQNASSNQQQSDKYQQIQIYNQIINKYSQEIDQKFENEDLINEIFEVDDISNLYKNIEKYKHIDFVEGINQSLKLQCPWSLYTNFELFRKVYRENLTFKQCVQLDYRLVVKFLLRNDFFEGIRCMLIDNQDKPKWEIDDINKIQKDHILKQIEEPLPGDQEVLFEQELYKDYN